MNLLEQKKVEVTMLQTQIQSLKYEQSITASKVREEGRHSNDKEDYVAGNLDGKTRRNEPRIKATYQHLGKIQ